jgi:hypothetical protein
MDLRPVFSLAPRPVQVEGQGASTHGSTRHRAAQAITGMALKHQQDATRWRRSAAEDAPLSAGGQWMSRFAFVGPNSIPRSCAGTLLATVNVGGDGSETPLTDSLRRPSGRR